MPENNEVALSFAESLKSETLDIAFDVTEASIDALIENDIIDAIPIVKTIKTGIKCCVALRERHLLKNTIAFLNELKKGNIDSFKLEKYKKQIRSKRNFESEIERVMFLIDKQTDFEKAKYLGKLYSATINGEISYEDFVDYSELVDRLFISDLNELNSNWKYLDDEGVIIVSENSRAFKRLSNQGLGELVYANVENDTLNINTNRYFFDGYSQNFVNILFDNNQEIKGKNSKHNGIKDYVKESMPKIRKWI